MYEVSAEAQESLNRFVREVVASGMVWGLKTPDDGWCFGPSHELTDENGGELEVAPFWSQQAEAQACVSDEWQALGFEPSPIPLAAFLERWLPGMQEEGSVAGINWGTDLGGPEVQAQELKQRLEVELAK